MATDDEKNLASFGQVARHLLIRGKVQGVGFRWHMVQQARSLGVSGWVRNCQDGSVEACIVGEHHKVVELIYWAGQGPALAQVASVQVEDIDMESAEKLLKDFSTFTRNPSTFE